MSNLEHIKERYEIATEKKAIVNGKIELDFVEALCKKIVALEKKIVELQTEKIDPALKLGELKKILTDKKEIEIVFK